MGKLVRDRIPDLIRERGGSPRTRILGPEDYVAALRTKCVEEAQELRAASDDQILDELADLYELVRTIARVSGHPLEAVVTEADRKRETRGGFDARIWLED